MDPESASPAPRSLVLFLDYRRKYLPLLVFLPVLFNSVQAFYQMYRYLRKYGTTLLLAYQSFGVVFGDLAISPIFVYKVTFSGKLRLHEEDAEILGVLSLIFWTLTLIALLKYTIIVLGVDDNGEGGTFALYSLMCRNSKIGLLHAQHTIPDQLVANKTGTPNEDTKTSLLIKNFFEKHKSSRIALLLFVLLGTSMVIGDGVLTPTMSVLSAVSGLEIKIPQLHEYYSVFVACLVLVVLFALQHYGTHRVGFLFAPVLIAWLGCLGSIGLYNTIKWNPSVVYALSPYYICNFLKDAGVDGWSSLGGVVLCITGAEAMFADLGHFSKLPIRMAFMGIVYPCLVFAYMGEAAYLSKHKEDLQRSFFKAIPEGVFWPVFVIATLATIVGCQAIISATFSIISQCRAFGCFPRVKIIHTSNNIHGQIYIPEVNWLLMLLCLALTIGFRNTDTIGNAYGLAVISVMLVTTSLMFLIITTIWNKPLILALLFILTFGSIESFYFTACLLKFPHGGWLPFLFSMLTLTTMSSWYYGTSKKLKFEIENKACLDRILSSGPTLGLVRVPGIALVYTNSISSVPPMFAHFVTNFPAFHKILIFISIQTFMVPNITENERFIIRRVGMTQDMMFWCVVRYGYKDGCMDSYEFENKLLSKLNEFLRSERRGRRVRFENECEEMVELALEREAGIAYMMGNTTVIARESSSWVKKMAIDGIYGFLRRNSRGAAVVRRIPPASLIEVGMVYHV